MRKVPLQSVQALHKARDLHSMVNKQFKPISNEVRAMFLETLDKVWRQQDEETLRTITRIHNKISSLEQTIANHVEAVTDPSNNEIKDNLLASIANKKQEIADLEDQLHKLKSHADSDKNQFLHFAFDFIDSMGRQFLNPALSYEHRIRCKLILFPAGFYLDADNKVYTPQISPIYGVVTNKKTPKCL